MVLIVGCGDLGGEIARLLHLAGHDVVGVRASNKPLPANIHAIVADVTKAKALADLQNLQPEILIYCVAANAQTDESYQSHYVDGLKNVLATQVNNHALKHVFFVSSTRVYGEKAGEMLDENSPAIPADFGGKRLLEAESLLNDMRHNSGARVSACEATTMRLSGIYGSGRLYLMNMAKELTRWPQQNSWSNRIHRDDAARFIAFCCEKVFKNQALASTYIVTDDMPTQQYEVLTWLANKQHVDTSTVNMPAAQGGKRLSNQRLRATGFALQYPNYQVGYGEILRDV